MQVEDRLVNLSPGMAVTVEIKTGQRTILSYLLSPAPPLLAGCAARAVKRDGLVDHALEKQEGGAPRGVRLPLPEPLRRAIYIFTPIGLVAAAALLANGAEIRLQRLDDP